MFKRRKNQPKADPQAKPAQLPPLSSPPSSSPNVLPALPNVSPNGLPASASASASPNPKKSAALSIPTTASTSDSDDEIVKFAKRTGIPESIVRIEFKIIQLLYNVSHKDIINRYHALHLPALLPILKLRYIRSFWKQLSQNGESDLSTQSRSNADNAE